MILECSERVDYNLVCWHVDKVKKRCYIPFVPFLHVSLLYISNPFIFVAVFSASLSPSHSPLLFLSEFPLSIIFAAAFHPSTSLTFLQDTLLYSDLQSAICFITDLCSVTLVSTCYICTGCLENMYRNVMIELWAEEI